MVPLSFALLAEISMELCDRSRGNATFESPLKRYRAKAINVHIFALVLDPLVPQECYAAVLKFLGGRTVLSTVMATSEIESCSLN